MSHIVYVIIIGSLLFISCDRGTSADDNKTKNQKEQEAVNVINKLIKAMNEHNLNAMLDCVDTGYVSEQPFYTDRNFSGREHMQKNWSKALKDQPDFKSDLKRYSVSNDTIWVEWQWTGTQKDSTRLDMRGVAIFKVAGGRITNGRLFMKSVE